MRSFLTFHVSTFERLNHAALRQGGSNPRVSPMDDFPE